MTIWTGEKSELYKITGLEFFFYFFNLVQYTLFVFRSNHGHQSENWHFRQGSLSVLLLMRHDKPSHRVPFHWVYIYIDNIISFFFQHGLIFFFFFLLGKKIPLRYLNFDILLRSTRGRLDHFIFFYFFILCCTYLYPYFCKTNPYWLLKTKKEKNVQLFLLNVQKNTPMNQISIFVFFRFGQQRAESIMQCIAILKVYRLPLALK